MRNLCSSIVVVAIVLLCGQNADAACGYKACPASKANMFNVHLVPHSHDDVGWLKTVDQYYYGAKNRIQKAGVQYILDNVIRELLKDSKRRFIYVETAFLFKWYNEQTTAMKNDVKKLINDGRLEIAGGAWSMNDEAAVHYQSVIDQFSEGLKQLSNTFGTCARPRVGWQIDPFGHSREMASLFSQMGYDGQFFARLDWIEKGERLRNLTAEMIWKTSAELGNSNDLFTGFLYNHYSAPPGFCFDALCQDDPIIDSDSNENNVKLKIDTFVDYVMNMTKFYRSNHIMVPMGDDFNYENALVNFVNMDKLIRYTNDRQLVGSKVNVFYSTPACYLNALHETTTLTWPNKTQDFFPYSSDWHSYWTGYYSSRPTQKRFERDGNHFLQVAKQLTTVANLTSATDNSNLDRLRREMGVMQHHDAITGTEKQAVAFDYDRRLTDALVAAQANTRLALQKLTNLTSGEFVSCLQLNISVCEFTRNGANNLVVTLWNPLAHPSTQYVRVPVKNEVNGYTVTDSVGRAVRSQVVPIPTPVQALEFRPKDTVHELVFEAYVDKLANYYVKVNPKPRQLDEPVATNTIQMPKRFKRLDKLMNHLAEEEPSARVNAIESRADTIVQTSQIKLTFSGITGLLTTVQMNGVTENIRQDFYYYKGAEGNNAEFKNRSSGAYIFRPNGTELLVNSRADLTVFQGTIVKEVHQRFNDWVSQVVRIYEGVNRVEFEWLVGPIPIADKFGKEVITRFTTNLNNKGVFWTDSNGREMMRRVRNAREYFKPNMTESVSGNYYPITARIAIESEQRRVALLNDRAQGGSSIKDGQLELMLHRRLLRDDAFGVGEALNETQFGKGLIARGKYYLIVNQANFNQKPTLYERLAQQEIHLPFWKFFSNTSRATNKVVPKIPSFSSLPLAIQVLTLEPFSATERLLRLENYMDRNETTAVTFNIRTIFDALAAEEIRETTLDGSMPLSDLKRFKFQPDGTKAPLKVEYYTATHVPLAAKKKDPVTKFAITMNPMEIRTYILKWK